MHPYRRFVLLFVLVMLVIAGIVGSGAVKAAGGGGRQHNNPVGLRSIQQPVTINPNRPVLAFYYAWYDSSSWVPSHLSDMPTIRSGNLVRRGS